MVWFKGEVIPFEDAKINIMTTTAQYGINVFEGIRCYFNEKTSNLYSFRLEEHLERLFNSSKLLRFKLDKEVTPEYIKMNLINVIKTNNYKEDIYVKIGLFLDGEGSWSNLSPVSLFIIPYPKGRVYADKKGINCCISSWERLNESVIPPRIKAGANYLNSRLAQLEAAINGYDSAIFLNRNYKVAEGPGACIFIIRKDKLITPSITSSILESITRDSIIKLAKSEFNIEIEEREVDRSELYIADEIFIVGTSVEIIPILSIDKISVSNYRVGEITKNLTKIYFDVVRGNIEKYSKWLTRIN